ncbi:MAG: dihydroneopterin triphosphate diphosphatase [Pseudomonadota bacterium]
MNPWKRPVSILAVIHSQDLQVLLLERAAHPGYWQSVTGSQEEGELLIDTAVREVFEETGISATKNEFKDWQLSTRFEIFSEWRQRYEPGVSHNVEHVFSLQVSAQTRVTLAPREHLAYVWLPWHSAAEKCFSPSNRDAILSLPKRIAR